MARGVGDIEGWHAVGWVGGMGAAMVLSSAVLWIRAFWLRDKPAVLPTYRSVPSAGSHRASTLRELAGVLLALCALSQLLYLGLYIELVQWLLGAGSPPRIMGDLFFWVALFDGTCVVGALWSAWESS